MLTIELLGGFRIFSNGKTVTGLATARLRSLLAYLTLHAGIPVSRQRLAFIFWTDSGEAQARTNLRQLLHHLRAALPELNRFLISDGQDICWQRHAGWSVDTVLFEQATTPEEAVRIYVGDLLPGFYDDWVTTHRERLSAAFNGVLDRAVEDAERRRDLTQAAVWAERRVGRDLFREQSHQTLIRLHAARGDRAAALKAYQRCAEVLRAEFGIEPGNATRRMCEQVAEAPAMIAATVSEIRLIGREREWGTLLGVWNEATARGTRLVMITGEAGIGKTRLLEELREHVRASGGSAARASCYSSSQALAYTAAGDWLRSAAIKPRLNELTASEITQLARVLPELQASQANASLPGPFTETWQRRHFFEALAHAVLLAPPPLLLSIDDLQWCDAETLEWLLYLVRFDATARMLIVATARIEEIGETHPVALAAGELARLEGLTRMQLGPLSEEDTLRLAGQLARTTEELRDDEGLYEQTRGNPLFVLETVRARPLARGEVAPKVQAVIGARLAHLPEPARQLSAVAAVIGRPFPAELAVQIAGLAEDTGVEALDRLWSNRILRFEEGGQYDFVHGCVRDTAYASIGPARRRQLHRLVAEGLEERGDEAASQIASHYEQAGSAYKAIAWYRRAASFVRRLYAESEAAVFLNKALRLLEQQAQSRERDELELDLLIELSASLTATEGFATEDATGIYPRARLLCELLGETDRYIAVLGGSWAFHTVRAELDIAREISERYVLMAERAGEMRLRAAGAFCLGSTTFFQGALSASKESLERSNEYDAQLTSRFYGLGPELGVFCRGHLSHLYWLLGDAPAAMEESRRNLARAEGLGHPFSKAAALAYAAMLHHFRDEPEAAREQAEAASALCAKYGIRYYLSWTPIVIGWARARMGDAADGLRQMREGFAALTATGARIRVPYYLAMIAQVAGWSGAAAAGLRDLEDALVAGERNRENWVLPELHRVRGDLLLQNGDAAGAEASWRSAVRAARSMDAKAWEERAILSLKKNLR